ncbi:unnamed protein product [Ilex paraguariensis]|uniref:Uncharacterized protein n=1 Tax=Ilex paraguariensis TaxID=185542 RepID=A0ABC8TZX5_9AQUA
MSISYVDMGIHPMIEGSLCDEVQKSITHLSNSHKDVWFEPPGATKLHVTARTPRIYPVGFKKLSLLMWSLFGNYVQNFPTMLAALALDEAYKESVLTGESQTQRFGAAPMVPAQEQQDSNFHSPLVLVGN